MKKPKRILSIIAVAVAITLHALSSSAEIALQTQGYEWYNCSAGLQPIDGGYNCTLSGSIQCTINGIQACDTQANCEWGIGLLKRN